MEGPEKSLGARSKTVARIIGPYRLVIDGAMLVAMGTLLFQISSWKTEMELRVQANAEAARINAAKLLILEGNMPLLTALPITAEADARLRVLEKTFERHLTLSEKWFDRVENKLDKLTERQK